MAILNQLIRPEEFARLPQEDQEIIKTFVNAGGAVAEALDSANARVTDIDNPRFIRKFSPQLKDTIAKVEGLDEAKAKLMRRF
jgi:hypothetical protein